MLCRDHFQLFFKFRKKDRVGANHTVHIQFNNIVHILNFFKKRFFMHLEKAVLTKSLFKLILEFEQFHSLNF